MRGIAVLLAALVGASAALVAHARAADAWRDIGSATGGFTVAMPGQPKLQSQAIGPHGEAITMYLLGQGSSSYVVAFTDMTAQQPFKGDPETVLSNVRANSVQGLHGKLREEHPLQLEGHPGRDVIIDDPRGMVTHARYILANNRLYQVVAVVPRGQEDGPEVRQFLTSFHFTNP